MRRSAAVIVKEMQGLVDELAEVVDDRLPSAEVAEAVVEVEGLRRRVDAVFTGLVGQLDADRVYAEDGARSARAWLGWRLRLPTSAATAAVHDARHLRRMPSTAAALAAGEIGVAQLRQLRQAEAANAEAFARDEAMLVDQAKTLWHDQLHRVVRYWLALNDADAQEERARRRYESRHVSAVRTWEDTVSLNGILEAVGGATVAGELERLEQIEFERDWRDAEARLGRRPGLLDLARTGPQRRHDALVEMARRSCALPDGAPRPRPLITAVVGHPVFERICQLSNGTVLTPGEVLPLLCDCDIERVVFGPDSRVLDVGAKQRFFTGATRRAVEIRDLTCTHPACDVGYEACEIDHIQPWARGGPTTQANGRCHCPHHNRSRPRSQLPSSDDDGDPSRG